jgi:hypothetical protein
VFDRFVEALRPRRVTMVETPLPAATGPGAKPASVLILGSGRS